MVEYIKRCIDESLTGGRPLVVGEADFLREIAKELDRFDTLDFEPSVRSDLVWARAALASMVRDVTPEHDRYKRTLTSIRSILDRFRGPGSRGVTRTFTFISNADLRAIVERDYAELVLALFPSSAWKSTVVMAGSILEAILHDQLTRDMGRVQAAMASSKAPTKKSKSAVKDITKDTYEDKWDLINLIEVCVDLGILPGERGKAIDQVLRDYRNFVHPRKEIKAKHPCTEAEALLAKGALDAVCNHFS